MRLLDLFCGAGGAAMGYHRAGFTEIVGVDIKPQPRYPFEFVQADAMEFMVAVSAGPIWDGFASDHPAFIDPYRFDAVHASPPCQAYVQRNKNLQTKHPKLIEPTRALLKASGLPYVIENVLPEVLVTPWLACGTAFGLPLRRHRYFEAPMLALSRPCHHWGTVAHGQFAAVYGRGGKGPRRGAGVRDAGPLPGAPSAAVAMGIDWMNDKEIKQAIPPAYTEYIGRKLIESLEANGPSESEGRNEG